MSSDQVHPAIYVGPEATFGSPVVRGEQEDAGRRAGSPAHPPRGNLPGNIQGSNTSLQLTGGLLAVTAEGEDVEVALGLEV